MEQEGRVVEQDEVAVAMGADGESLHAGYFIFEVGEPLVELFFGAFGVFVDHDLVFERKLAGVDSLIARMADPTDIGGTMIMVAMAGDHKQ
jgi:hypothetical protein